MEKISIYKISEKEIKIAIEYWFDSVHIHKINIKQTGELIPKITLNYDIDDDLFSAKVETE